MTSTGLSTPIALGGRGVDVIPDPPVPGAIEFLIDHLPTPKLIDSGRPKYTGPVVQIYSARSKEPTGVAAMKCWLVKYGLHSSYIEEDVLKFPTQKPAAFLTLDDRAICFTGEFPTTQEMLSFKPWNKK